MSPIESAQLAEMRDELRAACGKLDTLHRLVIAQSVLGARPWVPVAIALLALVVACGAAVRVEYVVETHRDLGGLYP